ncbi:MAG TPA: DUF1223 domain-containing protein [Methylomirabilota bacterium]|nr:DUF1223 domain-containing protein [Methylomirabilota bacterium]
MSTALAGVAVVVCTCSVAAAETLGVVELFTSQGCSSCPPADKVLNEIAQDPNIVALSFSVDYWDYLGWQDTLAKPEFTQRQKAYADARGDRSIYTPQVVVNGRDHVVGSNREKILGVLDDFAAAGKGMTVEVTARIEGDRIVVRVPDGVLPPHTRAAVWIASYREPVGVEIGRGENAGHEVTYTNAVERWQVLGMWDGDAMTVELQISDMTTDQTAGCAVVLQTKRKGRPGPILGAAKVSLAIN